MTQPPETTFKVKGMSMPDGFVEVMRHVGIDAVGVIITKRMEFNVTDDKGFTWRFGVIGGSDTK